MPLSRQKFREITFQMLFSLESSEGTPEDIMKLIMKELKVSQRVVEE